MRFVGNVLCWYYLTGNRQVRLSWIRDNTIDIQEG